MRIGDELLVSGNVSTAWDDANPFIFLSKSGNADFMQSVINFGKTSVISQCTVFGKTVGKTLGTEELTMILAGELHCHMLTIRG